MSNEGQEGGHWTPAAMGLSAFSFALFLLSVFNAGLVPASAMALVIGPCFFCGFVLMMAGFYGRLTDDLFGFTANSSYGMMLMALGFVLMGMYLRWWDFGAATGAAMGSLFLAASIFTLYMWIGSFKENVCLIVIFTCLLISLVALTLHFFGILASSAIGGWFGIITALAGWYTSAAIVLNTYYNKTILPM